MNNIPPTNQFTKLVDADGLPTAQFVRIWNGVRAALNMQQPAIPNLTAAPTAADFNGLSDGVAGAGSSGDMNSEFWNELERDPAIAHMAMPQAPLALIAAHPVGAILYKPERRLLGLRHGVSAGAVLGHPRAVSASGLGSRGVGNWTQHDRHAVPRGRAARYQPAKGRRMASGRAPLFWIPRSFRLGARKRPDIQCKIIYLNARGVVQFASL